MQRRPIINNSRVWIGGESFVQVIEAKVKGLVEDLKFEMRVINKHALVLTKLDYEVTFFTSAKQIVNQEPIFIEGDEVNIGSNSIGLASSIPISDFPNASHAEIKLVTAHFEGDNALDLVYESMELMELQNLSDVEKELLREVAGDDAINLPQMGKENWRCVCGYFNGINSETCKNCAREKNLVFQEFTSIDKIKEKIENAMKAEMDKIGDDSKEEEVSDEVDISKEIEDEKEEVEVKIKDFFASVPKLEFFLFMSSGVMLISSAIIWLMTSFN